MSVVLLEILSMELDSPFNTFFLKKKIIISSLFPLIVVFVSIYPCNFIIQIACICWPHGRVQLFTLEGRKNGHGVLRKSRAVYENRKLTQTRLCKYMQQFQIFLIIKFLQQNLMLPRF